MKPLIPDSACDRVSRRHATHDLSDPALAGNYTPDALYGSFQALVHSLINRFGDTPELREELKSEIYYRFCVLLNNYDKDRNVPLRPYMVCQLTASVYTFARQQRVRRQRELPLELDAERVTLPFMADPSDQWDENIHMREMCQHLPRVMQRLTQRQRQVVRWRYYEERSYEDIAGRLAVQPATARSILRHGLHNMRRMLEEDGYCAD